MSTDGPGPKAAGTDRAFARGGGAGAGRPIDGQGARGLINRSIDGETPIQTPLRYDVPSLSPRPADGPCPAAGPQRRTSRRGEKWERVWVGQRFSGGVHQNFWRSADRCEIARLHVRGTIGNAAWRDAGGCG